MSSCNSVGCFLEQFLFADVQPRCAQRRPRSFDVDEWFDDTVGFGCHEVEGRFDVLEAESVSGHIRSPPRTRGVRYRPRWSNSSRTTTWRDDDRHSDKASSYSTDESSSTVLRTVQSDTHSRRHAQLLLMLQEH